MITETKVDWTRELADLEAEFRARSDHADQTDTFVQESFDALRLRGFFEAQIPEELGGGGMSHADMCDLLRRLGRICSSTALSGSMHQHLVAVEVWKYKNGKSDGALLRKVAVARFSRTLGTMISSGVPILEARAAAIADGITINGLAVQIAGRRDLVLSVTISQDQETLFGAGLGHDLVSEFVEEAREIAGLMEQAREVP